ncbi:hypothetical protein HDU85_001216 [Gaertneriomyces sp. JEL0708]|nr:hypothetical protein HDU85_001216 [Gaertneriomyces sp. JEL0708]
MSEPFQSLKPRGSSVTSPGTTGDTLNRLHPVAGPGGDATADPPQLPYEAGSPTDMPNVPNFTSVSPDTIDTMDHMKGYKRGFKDVDPHQALSGVQLDRDHKVQELGSQKLSGHELGSTKQQDVDNASMPYTV